MATSIPQARVVRQGDKFVAPPPVPPMQREKGPLARQLETMLQVAVGLWPLTAVMLLMMGLLFYAGMNGSP